jgi:hypothetical protein
MAFPLNHAGLSGAGNRMETAADVLQGVLYNSYRKIGKVSENSDDATIEMRLS